MVLQSPKGSKKMVLGLRMFLRYTAQFCWQSWEWWNDQRSSVETHYNFAPWVFDGKMSAHILLYVRLWWEMTLYNKVGNDIKSLQSYFNLKEPVKVATNWKPIDCIREIIRMSPVTDRIPVRVYKSIKGMLAPFIVTKTFELFEANGWTDRWWQIQFLIYEVGNNNVFLLQFF